MAGQPDAEESLAWLRARAEEDRAAALLGMHLAELSPGYAKVTMQVRPEHRSFHGKIFGGIVLAIADQAFGYGSNSVAYPSLASQFNLHFLAAPSEGEELIAECRVLKSGRRVGISEITVTTREGKVIARATGTTIPITSSEATSGPRRERT